MVDLKLTQLSVHNPVFGPRNLGHYLGSMKNLIENQYEYDTIVVIDDVLALFVNPPEYEYIRNRSFFVVQDFINAGYDAEANSIVLTSQLLPEIMELMLFLCSNVDHKYCGEIFKNSFLGSLKHHQCKELGLSTRHSVLEMLYPQFAIPALSLGLNVEMFQGGEEIRGYISIMHELVTQTMARSPISLFTPVYEPAIKQSILGTDGKNMFQGNCVYLSEDELDLREKIDGITDKRVVINWFECLGYHALAREAAAREDMGYFKVTLFEILASQLKPFRTNRLTNSEIIKILRKSRLYLKEKLSHQLIELYDLHSISRYTA